MSAFKFTLYIKNLVSLRSRRLEVMGERENGRAQGRHGPNACSAGYLLVDNSSMPRTKKKKIRLHLLCLDANVVQEN